jgi:benzoyl-CoA reductase/2-hydroxyglutaryl-CoA dehydratase subunit BcrC/BadD/HgdB
MKQATYKFVFFPGVKEIGQYIGMAWNYDHALLISTRPCDSYALAQLALKNTCREMEVELRWFDGEYEYDSVSGSIVQAKLKHIYPEGIDK